MPKRLGKFELPNKLTKVEEGATAADKLGNNDENRTVREALSRALDSLSTATLETVREQQDGLITEGRSLANMLLIGTAFVSRSSRPNTNSSRGRLAPPCCELVCLLS